MRHVRDHTCRVSFTSFEVHGSSQTFLAVHAWNRDGVWKELISTTPFTAQAPPDVAAVRRLQIAHHIYDKWTEGGRAESGLADRYTHGRF